MTSTGGNPWAGFMGGGMLLFWLGMAVVFVIGGWKVYEKAGQPGWVVIVPIYNLYIMLKIVGRPGWWIVLYLIPLVNIVIILIVAIDLAKVFGQSALFGFILNFLLGGIGLLVLGFGDYRYVGSPNAPKAVDAAQG